MKLKSIGKYLRYRAEIIRERRRARNGLIIVEPFAGLANRMRVIASGIWLKNKIKGNLAVVWPLEDALNCPYELIFEDNKDFKVIRMNDAIRRNIQATSQSTRIEAIKALIGNKFMGVDHCIREAHFSNILTSGAVDLVEIAGKNKAVYFRTCHEFGDGGNPAFYKGFKPIAPIRNTIDHVARGFTAATIGVHVRRTDNHRSIRYSPVALFIEKMRQEVSANDQTNFFLATDDREVEKEMISVFGPRIIIHPKELNRATVSGIQDAAVDLYCLARTRKILGSFWSSYSRMAARIGQVELEIIKN